MQDNAPFYNFLFLHIHFLKKVKICQHINNLCLSMLFSIYSLMSKTFNLFIESWNNLNPNIPIKWPILKSSKPESNDTQTGDH